MCNHEMEIVMHYDKYKRNTGGGVSKDFLEKANTSSWVLRSESQFIQWRSEGVPSRRKRLCKALAPFDFLWECGSFLWSECMAGGQEVLK